MKKLLLSLLCLAGFAAANAVEITDVLTVESLKGDANFDATSTKYATFTVTGESGAVYSLQCAHNKGAYIQLRSNSPSGIISTTSAGKLVNVTVTWNSGSSIDRTLNIYGANEAFASLDALYDTKPAPAVAGTIVCGTSTSYDFTEDFEYLGLRSAKNAMYIDKIEITWENGQGVTVARPTLSVAGGIVKAGTEVTMSCETEGAEIYYTTNGTDPDKTSTKYTDALTINETVTVKAIAYAGDNASSVVTANFTVPVEMELVEVVALENGETFVMADDLNIVFKEGSYIYVYTGDTYSLIYANLDFKQGEIIKAGWIGKMTYYNGLPQLTPVSEPETTDDFADIPAYKAVAPEEITPALVNTPIVVKNVTLAEATPDGTAGNFKGTVGETELTFRNTFKSPAVNAGTYDIKCFVSIYNSGLTTLGTTIQLLPVEFKTTTGIADIDADSNVAPVYYNLQGVRVSNPEKGLYIEVRGNKATKVIK